MKYRMYAAGKVSAVVMDQHLGVWHHAADTTDELWDWLQKQDKEARPGEAFCMSTANWNEVTGLLSRRGWVHVETGFDCDLVITRHHR